MKNNSVLYMPKYTGTIMKRCLNGEDTIYDDNAILQYDEEYNTYFYYTIEHMQDLVLSLEKNLDKIIDEELDKKVDSYFLTTDIPFIEGQLYVDINSLKMVKKSGKNIR